MTPLKVLATGGRIVVVDAPVRQARVNLQKLARLRQSAYRLIGAALLPPDEALVAQAALAARDARRRNRPAAGLAFYGTWQRFLDSLQSLVAGDLNGLKARYHGLFGDGGSQAAIPLCESGYTDQMAMASGQVMADVEREYSSAGLSASSTAYASDHITVEMEFVSFLCGVEAEAMEAKDLEGAREVMERQAKFLAEHPCRWFRSLDRAVSARDGPGLYSAATHSARALATHDADFLLACIEYLDEGR